MTTNIKESPLKLLENEKARRSFEFFVGMEFEKLNYQFNWHHKLLCQYLQRFYKKEITNLMVFMPPQHGKSTLVSKLYPAWLLGKNPNKKVVGASYSSDLSSNFNREVQRIIDNVDYNLIFPKTYLNKSNVRLVAQGTYLRNSDIFEIVGSTGSLKSTGVGGSLTGSPCDIGIIDDPVKDAIEAYSLRTQETVWDWYINVFKTRLHNNSQTLLTMTRWHEDDLAGKILKTYKETGEKWDVLILPAIKEDNDNPEDIRQIGESLWEDRHSLAKINIVKKESIRTFTSLYQQRPAPQEGALIKATWFGKISEFDFLKKLELQGGIVNYFVDSAYTEKQMNDPTAIMATCFIDKILFILKVSVKRLEFPELLKHIPLFVKENSHNTNGRVFIEPKASGLSIGQQLRKETMLNIVFTPSPKDDKVTRVNANTAFLEGGRVYLVEGVWNDDFLHECKTFPNAKHDDQVDVLMMAIAESSKNQSPAIIWSSFGG